MPHFAANLSMLYNEFDFLDRFAAAARDGFRGVECLFPYDHAPQALAQRLVDLGLEQALFNAPPGDWMAGERGLACLPGREAPFRAGIAQALEYAQALRCERVHVMAGILPAGLSAQQAEATFVDNLRWAAEQAARYAVRLQIEPINRRDMPGYFLQRQGQAHALLQAIAAPNVQVQMDLYHCQIMEGDLATALRRYLPTGRVGHLQVAGVPSRHEPDEGEVRYEYLFGLIDALSAPGGFDGWVGCEYRPRDVAAGGTSAGLVWLQRWRDRTGAAGH